MFNPGDKFYLDARGIRAEGVVIEGGFRVLAGSEVQSFEVPYLSAKVSQLRAQLLADGTIVDWKLTRDVDFKSTSTAAYFLFGANASGPQTWKNADGISMAKLEKVASGVIPNTDNEFLSFYKVVGGNEGSKCHYPARLDTYGRGCGHDCSYCYAKSTLYFHGQWNPERPDVADIRRIENRIRKLEKGTIVRLGGMTDCFQPCELEYRVTLKTIQLLNKYGIGYLIVTKSHHVADDEYLAVMDPKLAHIQITVTTTDDERSLTYEKASVPSKRIEAIEKLYAAGFDVAFRLSPFIEGYIDFDVLNNVRCDKILVEFLRTNQFIKKWFDVSLGDALLTDPGYRVDIVLTNPPFGKKSSMTFTNEEGEQESEDLVYNRTDFWTTTSNKQLNFVQHINTLMKATGRAAVVLPDNVLFEGGAGEIVRRKLLETTDLHTILRLPTGIFYKPGVNAHVR